MEVFVVVEYFCPGSVYNIHTQTLIIINPTLPRNVELKLKVNSFSIEIENGVISIYTFDPTSN